MSTGERERVGGGLFVPLEISLGFPGFLFFWAGEMSSFEAAFFSSKGGGKKRQEICVLFVRFSFFRGNFPLLRLGFLVGIGIGR